MNSANANAQKKPLQNHALFYGEKLQQLFQGEPTKTAGDGGAIPWTKTCQKAGGPALKMNGYVTVCSNTALTGLGLLLQYAPETRISARRIGVRL